MKFILKFVWKLVLAKLLKIILAFLKKKRK